MNPIRRRTKTDPGPNPDPQRYILVTTREGSFYRQKRGQVRPVSLNAGLQRSADCMKVCNPAAKRLVAALRAHLEGLQTGRIIARASGMLRRALYQKGIADYSYFAHYDLQDDYPLEGLLQAPYEVKVGKGSIEVSVTIDRYTVKRHNSLVSHYYFDAVLVWGDPTKEKGLRVDSTTSPLYPIGEGRKSSCSLLLELPKKEAPWMVLLKVSCLEGNELAVHPRHYGMRVVAVG